MFDRQCAMCLCLLVVSLTLPVAVNAQHLQDSEPVPHWIWHGGLKASTASEVIVFEKEFSIRESVLAAHLRIVADFCSLKISIDDRPVASIEAFSPTVDIDVANSLVRGRNVLRVEAQSVPGPVALALSLQINGAADGMSSQTLVTDASWSVNASEAPAEKAWATSLGLVSKALWGIEHRDLQLDVSENYEQWRQAEAGRTSAKGQFWTAPNFDIALIRSAEPDEDSWVSMAFDPQGRLTIAKEEQGLLRFTFNESKSAVEKVEPLMEELLECRGLVYGHDALYVNANNSKAMVRVSDSIGDDVPDEAQMLREFPGGVGHGRNDLGISHDGWIYSIHGDSVDIPQTNIIDRTSPLRAARQGKESKEGCLVRTDPTGKNWELLCAGMRNPFGVAENADGEWFTYDADAEFDMGSPWYRPTRILHLVSGADFGWRGVTGSWPPYFPDHSDNAMPTLDIGRGSPTAVLFGTHAHFPADYQRALFVLDWTYGRILAVHLAPRGAGYRAQAETFLQGRPLNVTDLAIGPDGAMYVITGGRKTQSALYRIAYRGDGSLDLDNSQHERAAIADGAMARGLRRQLELGHGAADTDLTLAWQHLNSPDWSIRHAARIALEHQPIHVWRDAALRETRPLATIESLLALARSNDSSIAPQVLERLLQLSAEKLSLTELWGVLRCYGLLSASATDIFKANRVQIITHLERLLPGLIASELRVCRCGTNAQALREAVRLLAELEAESIVDLVAGTMLSSVVQEDQLQGLFVLRNIKHGWTSGTRETYFRLLNAGSQFVRGEGMPKFLNTIREEALATLSDHERNELAELLQSIEVADEPLPAPRPPIKQWSTQELVDIVSNSSYQANAARGADVFREALCNHCHRSGARGPAVGPDLTHVARRFSRQDLIASIVTPSQVVAENYRSVQVVTRDGQTITGRALVQGDYRSQMLQINTDPLRSSQVVELDKRQIEEFRESPVSPMPAGLLDGFTSNEILDLLEYLTN